MNIPASPDLLRRPTLLYDAYIFDLDGTVYLGDRLLPTAVETITSLRQSGRRTLFLSNNPTQTAVDYAHKLTRLGLPTAVEDVINSSQVMVTFLQRRHPKARLFVVGEEPLRRELAAAGFQLTEEAAQVDAVIASFDRTFDYHKLQVAFDAVRAGARFFATNADRFCPVPGGGEPDAAAVIAAIEACTSQEVEAIVGKPSIYMAEAVLDRLQLAASRCLMTGDRLETDVRLGLKAGMSTALTLTGAAQISDLADSPDQPAYIINCLADLLPSSTTL